MATPRGTSRSAAAQVAPLPDDVRDHLRVPSAAGLELTARLIR